LAREKKESDYMGSRVQVQKKVIIFSGLGGKNLRIGTARKTN
jgi:hypothetical protein